MGYAERAKKESDEDLLETFKGWFKQVQEVESGQRKRENEDLRGQVGEYRWPEKARLARMGVDGAPARPTLSISLTKQPMQLVKNQAAAADLGVQIHAVSEKSDKEVAQAKQGLYRRIERDSNAPLARLWGFDRAVQCGRGWYQVVAQFDEDGDNEFDQELCIKRILDGARVGIDPSAQEPDYADANWAYLDEYMDLDTFKDNFPDAEIAGLSEEDFADLASIEPGWVTGSEGKRAVRVPQVWRKKHHRVTVCAVKAKPGEQADAAGIAIVPKADVGKRKVYASKTRDEITLCWYRITARDVLDHEEYEGLRLIPLIPVVWNELQPFDGERRWEGMQRPAKDGQQAFDFAISGAVEDVGRLSKVPYIGPTGTFEGHQEKWNTINTRNWPFLEYNIVKGPDNAAAPGPAPMQIDGTKLGLSLQLAEMAKGLVQSATAVYDPSLGKTEGPHESGRKVLALQQQADAGTSNGLENLSRLTLNYEARVVLERLPYYYDRPGRVVQILGEEDKERTVMLNAHYSVGDDGRPQRVVGRNTQGAKMLDFRKGGKYATAISVGKSYQTRMQQGQEVWSQLMPNLPPEAQVILLPTVMRFMDTPGATDAADLMAKFRDSKFPGLVDDKENGPTPEQLKAQLAGMQQAMQQQGQQLQMAMQKIETDFAKQQATWAKAQLDAQTVLHKAEMDNAAMLAATRLKTGSMEAIKGAELDEERAATGLKLEAENARTMAQIAHETKQQHEDMAHDVGMAAGGGNTIERHTEQGHESGQEHTRDTSTGASRESTQSAETQPQADGSGD